MPPRCGGAFWWRSNGRSVKAIRSGGRRDYPWHEAIDRPVAITINGVRAELPAPRGELAEITVDVPTSRSIDVRSTQTYRVFHWFILQPE